MTLNFHLLSLAAWLADSPPREVVQAHFNNAERWINYRMVQAKGKGPTELDARLLEIGRLLAALPETVRMTYIRTATDKLGLTRGDLKRVIALAITNGSDTHSMADVRNGQMCFLGEPLANFAAHITHELTLDDGENPPTCRYTLSGKLASGEPLRPLEIPADDFDSLKWIAKSWGVRPILYVSSSQKHKITRGIQELSIANGLKRETVYTFTGWTTLEDKRAYLTASGAITATGLDETVRVDLGGNNLRHYDLPAPPEDQDRYTAVRASLDFLKLANRKVTAPLWAAMYAAPLTALRSFNAVLWVWGMTQSGKSTLPSLALTHYGAGFVNGREYHAPTDWTSTATALEGALFKTKDTALVIDDFAPAFQSRAEAAALARKANYTVRSVGNRSSRSRSRADLTEQVTRIPRGLAVSTAENPLIGQSVVGRLLYVPVERGMLFSGDGRNEKLDAAQQAGQGGQYAAAFSAYI